MFTQRYPQLSRDFDDVELLKKWNDLIRVLEDKDAQTITPYDRYGRTVLVKASDMVNIGYVNTNTPDGNFWYQYTYQVPNDAGTVIIQHPLDVGQTQVRVFLPKASLLSGTFVTAIPYNPTGSATTLYISAAVISGDTFSNATTETTQYGFTAKAFENTWHYCK